MGEPVYSKCGFLTLGRVRASCPTDERVYRCTLWGGREEASCPVACEERIAQRTDELARSDATRQEENDRLRAELEEARHKALSCANTTRENERLTAELERTRESMQDGVVCRDGTYPLLSASELLRSFVA